MPSISLYYTAGSSDKEYNIQLTSDHTGYSVSFQYGRRGSAINSGYKIQHATASHARKVYERLINEKVTKGYTTRLSGEPGSVSIIEAILSANLDSPIARAATPEESSLHSTQRDMDLPVPERREPEMEVIGPRRILWTGSPALQVASIQQTSQTIPLYALLAPLLAQQPNPVDESEVERLIADPEWCMQRKYDGKKVLIRILNGEGQAFNKKGQPISIPPAIITSLKSAGVDLELDGELIGQSYVIYDILRKGNQDLRHLPYDERYKTTCPCGVLTNDLIQRAEVYRLVMGKTRAFNQIKDSRGEGVVFKRLTAPFTVGRPASGGDMLKFKFYATCSCVVLEGRTGKRSVGLGLYAPDALGNQVLTKYGNVTIPPNKEVPPERTVIEVRYLYAFPNGGSIYQPTYIGPRDDVDVTECHITQLKFKED